MSKIKKCVKFVFFTILKTTSFVSLLCYFLRSNKGAASIALAKQPSVFPEGLLPAKQQPFLKYLKDILRGCLLCFAGGTEGMQANPKV
jgi:hypothetical protein